MSLIRRLTNLSSLTPESELKQLAFSNRVSIVYIHGTAKSGSTIAEVILAQLADLAVHLQGTLQNHGGHFRTTKLDSDADIYESACGLIANRVHECLEIRAKVTVVIKERANFSQLCIWQRWIWILLNLNNLAKTNTKVRDLRDKSRPMVRKANSSETINYLNVGKAVSLNIFPTKSQQHIRNLIPLYLDLLYANEQVDSPNLKELDDRIKTDFITTYLFVACAIALLNLQNWTIVQILWLLLISIEEKA